MWLLIEKAKKNKNSLTIKELEKLIPYLSEKYYNQDALVEDQFFDELVDLLKEKKSDSKVLQNIGAPVREDVKKVKLPVWMGSLDKVKPASRDLELWLERFPPPTMISDKLDGISALLRYHENGTVKLYTRGDGETGQDISYLVPALKLPQLERNTLIRGELIITKKVFEEKYKKEFPKARSVVAGVVNAKKPSAAILADIDFLAYELIDNKINFIVSEQMKLMKKLKFKVVYHHLEKYLNEEILIKLLKERKKESEYEIDGLVLTDNQFHDRNKSGNPKYAVAFKTNEKGKLTTVLEVEWQASKHGILIPRLKFEPIILDGDTVQYCTAFHANFIRDNRIGPGSEIKVVKSGDVIPYVTEVVKSTKASFPPLAYHWNETEVDIILDENDDNVLMKQLTNFFKILEIDGVSEGTVKKLIEAKFDTIEKIYHASEEDFLKLKQFKEKSASKLYQNIHSVLDEKLDLAKIMAASMIFGFGFGRRRLTLLIEALPKILERGEITLAEVLAVDGFSEITAQQFIEYYDDFWLWLDKHSFFQYRTKNKKENKKENKKGKYTDQYVVITGFRNADLEKQIKAEGGNVQSSVNSKTTLVIAKDLTKSSSKLKKAADFNIPIEVYKTP
jgi:NAD-dependent DNA ligase